jgi:uncharacterized alkaline shock family protein YloU
MDHELSTQVNQYEGGKIVFAPDVIATIASLATTEVDGISGMSGGVVEELTGKLGKKSYTKGIKIDMDSDTVAVDMTVVVKYGYRLQDVCTKVQKSVKSAIETMTGKKVSMVNISVQSIVFEKAEAPVKPAED